MPVFPALNEMPEILRDQSKWPLDFKWNYSRVCGCVIGLAVAVAGFESTDYIRQNQVEDQWQEETTGEICKKVICTKKKPWATVTAKDAALFIEEALANV